MKTLRFFILSIIMLVLLVGCDPEEKEPSISNLSVCDTTFTDHNGCDNHHNEISNSAAFITGAVTVDEIPFESSFQFSILSDGEVLGSSPLTSISSVLNEDDLSDRGQVFGYTWKLTEGQMWSAGNFTMEVTFNTVPELKTSKIYLIQ